MKRLAAAALAAAVLLVGAAACGGTGTIESSPSSGPSTQTASADRTSSPRATRASSAAPARTTAAPARTTAEPARTTAAPTRTTVAPTRTTAEAARTVEPAPAPEPPRSAEAVRTSPPVHTSPPVQTSPPAQAAPSSTPAAVQVVGTPAASGSAAASTAEEGGGPGLVGWLLLIGLFAALVVLVLVSRSRRVAGWRAEVSALAAETRAVLDVPLTRVLSDLDAPERAASWPPVRDELARLDAGWADLSGRAPETAGQATAARAAGLLRNLITAVDAEGDALASGADWHLLRRDVNATLDDLDGLLAPQPSPEPPPGTAAYSA